MKTVSDKMIIEIWSDIMCPFCYLGKRKFEKALEQFPGNGDVEVVWKSFQLNPDLRTDPTISIHEYLSAVKGIDPARARQMNDNVMNSAREAGLEYNFDKVVVANTFKAHMLLHFAKRQGKQGEMKEALLRAYFTDGKNMDDTDTLTELAFTAGLKVEGLPSLFDDEAFIDEVREDFYEARQFGIRGVPFFVFNRKYAVSGAQDSEVFSEILGKSFAEWRSKNPAAGMEVVEGESCDLNGNC
jgi:predicted DsbA family dithiol-disulfide isomerase